MGFKHSQIRFNAWRRFAARLGLCGLLLQSLFPAVFSSLLLTSPAMAADVIVLCTADGPKTVSLADIGGTPLSDAPAKSMPHAPYCPACPGFFQANAAIPPATVVMVSPERIQIAIADPAGRSVSPVGRFAPQSPRAPPRFA